ncbi:hypothetical protein [Serratia fonticola]|uniref:hypothetical protein n=1 Tax=Serratia fonticola TaxID=47917 RepID=UPI0021BDC3ED|nr:hypothetical protein [Serratia fonticola]
MNKLLKKMEIRASSIAQHEKFKEVVAYHHKMISDVYNSSPLYYKTLFKSNKFILGICLLSIYVSHEDPTIDQVKEHCGNLNIFSANSISSFIVFLRVTGRIITTKNKIDKRKLNYRPTKKALDETELLIKTMIFPLKKITPNFAERVSASSENFVLDFFVKYSQIFFANIFMHVVIPDSSCFILKDAGHMMIINIMIKHINSGSNRFAFNMVKSAKECGVSRTHLKKALLDAQKEGLLEVNSLEGELILNDTFHTMSTHYMALYLACVEYGALKELC